MSESEKALFAKYNVTFSPDQQLTTLGRFVAEQLGEFDPEAVEDIDYMALVLLSLGSFTPDLTSEKWYIVENIEENSEITSDVSQMNLGTVVAIPGTQKYLAIFARVYSAA